MEQQESIFVRNAKIIGVAGVAAGVIGGVAGRLLQGQREPTRQERLQLALADLTGKDMSSLRDLVGDASATVKDDARRALAESKRSRGAARKRGRKAKAAGLSFTDHMRDALRQGAEQVGETLQGAIDETSRSLSHYAEEVSAGTAAAAESSKTKRDKAKKRADKTRSEVEARAREGRKEIMKFRQDASGKAKDARSKAEDRLHVLEDLARETVEKKVKPSLEKATASAAVGATEARKRIGEEAKHIEHLYAEAKPKVQESVEHYGARATEVGSELRHTAAERAHEAEKALQDSAHQARQVASDVSTSAKQGGKDASSFMLWVGIAAGLVYLVFLNDEQKKKARETAKSAYHEGMAIYRDIKGENADFQSA